MIHLARLLSGGFELPPTLGHLGGRKSIAKRTWKGRLFFMEVTAMKRIITSLVLVLIFIFTMSGPVMAAKANYINVNSGESIQEAINGAIPGDTIVVHGGTYHESLVVDRPLIIRGIDNPTILAQGGMGIQVLATSTISGFVIEPDDNEVVHYWGIYLEGNTDGSTVEYDDIQDGFLYGGISFQDKTDITIRYNRITSTIPPEEPDGASPNFRAITFGNGTNTAVVGNSVQVDAGWGIEAQYGSGTLIQNNTLYGNSEGINVTDSQDVVVTGNAVTIGRFYHDCGDVHGITFVNMTDSSIIHNNVHGGFRSISVQQSENIVVSDNYVEAGVGVVDYYGYYGGPFNENSDVGFEVSNTNQSTLKNNYVYGGFWGDGIYVFGDASNNSISSNTVMMTAGVHGIELADTTQYNIVKNNKISGPNANFIAILDDGAYNLVR
jgi:parallel beta-helix repeat protein